MLSRCSTCNNKKSTFTTGPTTEPNALARSSSERISQGSVIFDSLVYNKNQDRMKDVFMECFNR